MAAVVPVVFGDDGRDIVSPFVRSGNSGCSDGDVCFFTFCVELYEYIARSYIFNRHFSCRIGCSIAENGVANHACKSAAALLHACMCAVCITGYGILV